MVRINTSPERGPREENENALFVTGSPLALIGLFVHITRSRFSGDLLNPLPWTWQSNISAPEDTSYNDDNTKIMIESDYAKNIPFNLKPAITVGYSQAIPQKNTIGNQVGQEIHNQVRGYHSNIVMPIVIQCKSTLKFESALIAEIVWSHYLVCQEIICKEFGLYEITSPMLGAPVPIKDDVEVFVTPVTFQVTYNYKWYTQEILPRLREFRTQISNSNDPDDILLSITSREDVSDIIES